MEAFTGGQCTDWKVYKLKKKKGEQNPKYHAATETPQVFWTMGVQTNSIPEDLNQWGEAFKTSKFAYTSVFSSSAAFLLYGDFIDG